MSFFRRHLFFFLALFSNLPLLLMEMLLILGVYEDISLPDGVVLSLIFVSGPAALVGAAFSEIVGPFIPGVRSSCASELGCTLEAAHPEELALGAVSAFVGIFIVFLIGFLIDRWRMKRW